MNEFIENFAAQLDETDVKKLGPETKLREIEEWSSLTALSIIAMADEIYQVKLKGEDIRKAITIRDIYEVVQSRIS